MIGLFRVGIQKSGLCRALQVEVERQHNTPTRHRLDLLDAIYLSPLDVDNHIATSRATPKMVLKASFETSLTNDFTRAVASKLCIA